MSKEITITDLVSTGTDLIQNPTAVGLKVFKALSLNQKKTVALVAGIALIIWALNKSK